MNEMPLKEIEICLILKFLRRGLIHLKVLPLKHLKLYNIEL